MDNNLEYVGCQDLANRALAGAALWRLVGTGLTLSSPRTRRVSRSCLGALSSIFAIRRMRSLMAVHQPGRALFPALANQPPSITF